MSKTQSEAAKKRWERIRDGKETDPAPSIADAMKEFWAGKTKEERLERAKKAAATRKANRIAKLQEKRK